MDAKENELKDETIVKTEVPVTEVEIVKPVEGVPNPVIAEVKTVEETKEVLPVEPKAEPVKEEVKEITKETDQSAKWLDSLKAKDSEITDLNGKYAAEQNSTKTYKENAERLEAVIKTMVDSKIESIPEEYKGLIPEGNPEAQLAWLTKATETGLFNKKTNPELEIGRTLSTDKKQPESTRPLTTQQKMANHFSSIYKK